MGTFQFHEFASYFLKSAIFISFVHLLIANPNLATAQKGKIDRVLIAQSDFEALQSIKLDFIDPRGTLKSWNGTRNLACSGIWVGIRCFKGHIVSLQLPFKTLSGKISPKIGVLKELRKLSLHDNLIGGTIPSSLGFLPNLRGLYLFNNRFSGSVPPSIGGSSQLQSIDLSNNLLVGSVSSTLVNSPRVYRVNLSFNSFSGSIPPRFSSSPSLTFLALEHNNLSGPIPGSWGTVYQLSSLTLDHNKLSGKIPNEIGNLVNLRVLDLSSNGFNGEIPISIEKILNLSSFNVSHNSLTGKVPPNLAKKFKSSSFVGNLQLCGFSTSNPCPSPPPMSQAPAPKPAHGRKLSIKDIILILVGSLLAILLLLCCVLLFCLIRKRTGSRTNNVKLEKGLTAVGGADSGEGGNNGGKLVLFDGPFVFTADDLLCASAEIMGKSPFGTVYKATLEDGTQVTVKRLREKLAKSPKEFENEVVALGRIRHANLLPLRAYYLGPKGEKLLVFDYLSKGSLSSFLHAEGTETTIDWATRKKIATGITRGLTHLHIQENLVHGNLTSSGIYLDEKHNPKIGDYGIHKLMLDSANTNVSVTTTAGSTGYRAPELPKTKKPTKKTDIYSLGVIFLELLTGKSPSEAIDGSDLPQWVASTVKEEWTNEVFDLKLMKDVSNTGDEILNTLKLSLHLVDPSPDLRPDAQKVMEELEEIDPSMGGKLATDEKNQH